MIINALWDDITMCGTTKQVCEVLTALCKALKELIGVELQPSKCNIYAPQFNNREQAKRFIHEGIPTNSFIKQIPIETEGITIAGAPIGTQAYQETFVLEKLQEIRDDAVAIQDLNDWTISFTLMKQSLNQKIMHLLRALGPDIMQTYAKEFDAIIQACFCNLTGIHDLGPIDLTTISEQNLLSEAAKFACAMNQLRDSPKNGGLGITSMQAVAPAAFFAATLRFYAKINNRPAKNGGVDPAQVKGGLSEQFIKTAEHFTTRGAEMIKADEDRKKISQRTTDTTSGRGSVRPTSRCAANYNC